MGRYEGRYVFLVRSCVLITLIKCLKGHKSPGDADRMEIQKYHQRITAVIFWIRAVISGWLYNDLGVYMRIRAERTRAVY